MLIEWSCRDLIRFRVYFFGGGRGSPYRLYDQLSTTSILLITLPTIPIYPQVTFFFDKVSECGEGVIPGN